MSLGQETDERKSATKHNRGNKAIKQQSNRLKENKVGKIKEIRIMNESVKLHKTLKDQEQQIEYYKQEISNSEKLLDDLQHDSIVMEKTARENYMMKRDNEVVYLIEASEE